MSEYKVLIPLDGSRFAEHGLAFLPALSRLGELDVTLVSVVDFPDDLLEIVASEEVDRELNLLETYQREIAADLERHLGAKVRREVTRGTAPSLILDQAREVSPDLLVISTHGRSGMARWQRGAVADKVIRGAECDVLAVGPKAMEHERWLEAEAVPAFKEVLVPLDGSETAEHALPVATRYADVYGSRLHLFQVMPYIPLASGFWETPENLREDVLRSGREYLTGVLARRLAGRDGVEIETAIGAPASEVQSYVDAHGIDLVVMTSRGRGGIARTALGSVTDRVIGVGPPVLIVRG